MPSLIMSRVESASGARYSAHNEQARKFEPIAPVGTNYTPVGKVDIASLRSAAPPAAPKPAVPSAPRPAATPSAPPVRSAGFGSTAAASRVPEGTWDAPKPTAFAPPPPTAPRPSPTVTSAQRSTVVPAHSAIVASSNTPTKPAEDDRIGPVVSPTRCRSNDLIDLTLHRAPPTRLYHSPLPRNSITLSRRAHRPPCLHNRRLLLRAPQVLVVS